MKSKKSSVLLICAVLLLICCSCGQGQNDIGGIPVTPEMLESVSRSLAETTVDPPKTQDSENTIDTTVQTHTVSVEMTTTVSAAIATQQSDPTITTLLTSSDILTVSLVTTKEIPAETTVITVMTEPSVVYWTESGTVYHLRETCSSLTKSKKILHGSIEEALLAEKERVCKRCS